MIAIRARCLERASMPGQQALRIVHGLPFDDRRRTMSQGTLRGFKETGAEFLAISRFIGGSRYLLHPRFRMRREKTRILLYSFVPELGTLAGSYHMLHPRTAILLSLFDGERTFDDVVDTFRYIIDDQTAPADALRGIRRLLGNLLADNPKLLVEPKDESSRNPYQPSPFDFIIDADLVDLTTTNPVLDFPLTVNFHLNLSCNRKCLYCYAPSHTEEREHMPVSRFIELFEEATENGAAEVQFAGADPLLNPDVVQLTAEVVKRGYSPFISTKQYVSPERARSFAEAGLEYMQISLDSVDPTEAALLTGCDRYLDLALRSIDHLQAAGIKVRIKAVATGLNIAGIPRLIRAMAAREVVSVLVDAYGRSVFRHTDDLWAPNDAIARCLAEIPAIQREFPRCTIITTLEPWHPSDREQRVANWKKRAACSAGRSSMMIMTDGSIIACDQVPVQDAFILGDVSRSSIREQWHSAGMRRMVYPGRESMNEPCRSCDDYEQCCLEGGRCLRDVFVAFGTAADGDPKCPRIDVQNRY
jgi:PqqA peptide cyclase